MARDRKATPKDSWQTMLPGVILLGGLALFLLIVIEVGSYTRAQLSGTDRYLVDFAEIECPPPPAQKRADFLAEVQLQSGLPARLNLLDEGLNQTLYDAFARHPYVDKVERVAVLPSREVTVRLAYRIPVLEVMLSAEQPTRSRNSAGSAPAEDQSWFVDGKGILLPRKRLDDPLPLLLVSSPPEVKTGQPWGTSSVEAAAETAAFLRTQQPKLHLKVFEFRKGELVLSTPAGSKVLWGRPPGAEATGEARAAVKLDRLLDYCTKSGGLDKPGDRYEHDVRPGKEAIHRVLPE
jgi:hypothetical protein